MLEGGQRLAAPRDYFYNGTDTLVWQQANVPFEALPTQDTPGTLPWETSNPAVDLTIPCPLTIQRVQGWAIARLVDDDAPPLSSFIGCAEDGRDLFAVRWDLDANTSFQGDGNRPLLLPACVVVGTAAKPRYMSWDVASGRKLNVTFKNLLPVFWQNFQGEVPEMELDCFLTMKFVQRDPP